MKILRIFMGFVAMLLTVAALLCAFAHFYFFTPAGYENDILCDEFYAAALNERDKALNELESVVAVDPAVLKEFFNDESCKAVSAQYVRGLLSEVLEGKTGAMEVEYAPTGLREYLQNEFKKYDFSGTEYGDSATAAEKAYEMTVARMSSAVCFTPQTYVQKALRYIANIRSAAETLCSLWYVFAIGAVALAVGTVFMSREGALKGLFLPTAFLWCGCMLVFIPAMLAYFGDIAATLELSRNQLYYFLTGAITAMKDGVFITTVVPAVILTALLGFATWHAAVDNRQNTN